MSSKRTNKNIGKVISSDKKKGNNKQYNAGHYNKTESETKHKDNFYLLLIIGFAILWIIFILFIAPKNEQQVQQAPLQEKEEDFGPGARIDRPAKPIRMEEWAYDSITGTHLCVTPESVGYSLFYDKKALKSTSIYVLPHQPAKFAGSEKIKRQFINSVLNYYFEKHRTEWKNENAKGLVFVQFVVNTDGTISDISVLRSPHPKLNDPCIYCYTNMPLWTPAQDEHGNPVRSRVTERLEFK